MGPWPSLEIWLKVPQELAPSDSTQLPSMASPGCHQRALGPPQNEVTVTFLLKKGAGLRGCTTDHQHGTSPERQEPDQCILSLSGPSVDSTQGLNPHKNHLQSVGGVSYTHLYLMWGGIFSCDEPTAPTGANFPLPDWHFSVTKWLRLPTAAWGFASQGRVSPLVV